MKILIANKAQIPVIADGGKERIVWWLGKELVRLGHEVIYLAKKGSTCPFAKVLFYNEKKPIHTQIPKDIDIAHFHFAHQETLDCPMIFTEHRNAEGEQASFHPNTLFVSQSHAMRHGGEHYVYNGLDFDDYGQPDLDHKRRYFHFLANAAWKVKNVEGAIDIASKAGERLHVIGGSRINIRSGRFTLKPSVRFHGMVGGEGKNALLNGSKGLVFPVLWPEPFGLNIIESLYFGCPVFGTPNGSLPELLGHKNKQNSKGNGEIDAFFTEFGVLSNKTSELVEVLKRTEDYDRKKCHDYVVDSFSSKLMAKNYLHYYELVLHGESLYPKGASGVKKPEPSLEIAQE